MTGIFRHAKVFLTLALGTLGCSDGGGPSEDDLRILALGPNRVTPGAGAWVIAVRGTGFADSAVVHVNGSPRQTSFESSARVYVFFLYTDTVEPGTVYLQVVNPDNSRSNRVPLVIATDATSLAIDSIVPGPEREISPGSPVTVFFNEALDESTLTDTSLVVRDESGPLSGTISYDAGTRSITLSTTLAPARRFMAHLSDEIQSVSRGFTGSRDWTFSTSLGPTTVVDTMSSWPSLVLGFDGRPRVAYQGRETVGFSRLRLAVCGGDCSRAEGWTLSIIDQGGSAGGYASLTRDAVGQLHYGYEDFHVGAIYASGPSQRTVIEGNQSGAFTTIAASPTGAIHLLYYANGDLHGASCTTTCSSSANWTVTAVDTTGNVGSFGSAAVDAGGGAHVTYYENDAGDLRYATCPAPCSTPDWTSGTIAAGGQVGIGSSLVVDGAGAVHSTWLDVTANTVMYGTCSTECTVGGNWAVGPVDQVGTGPVDYGFYYTSLALAPGGKLEAVYTNPNLGLLRGASCSGGCATPGSWSAFTVSWRGARGYTTRAVSLEMGADGRRHVVWTDTDALLRYVRY